MELLLIVIGAGFGYVGFKVTRSQRIGFWTKWGAFFALLIVLQAIAFALRPLFASAGHIFDLAAFYAVGVLIARFFTPPVDRPAEAPWDEQMRAKHRAQNQTHEEEFEDAAARAYEYARRAEQAEDDAREADDEMRRARDELQREWERLQRERNEFEHRKTSRPSQDPYEIFELPRTATAAEIKARYRKLVGAYHPDKVIDAPPEVRKLAEERLKLINQAYKELQAKAGG